MTRFYGNLRDYLQKNGENLESLIFEGAVDLKNEDLEPLKDFSSLRKIEFRFCSSLNNQIFNYLKPHKNLRNIRIETNNNLTNEGLKGFLEDHPHLEVLIIEGCSQINEEGFKPLINHSSLQFFLCDTFKKNKASMKIFAPHKKLKSTDINIPPF